MTQVQRLFHLLWTKTVGTPGYVKEEWIQLCNAIDGLELENTELRNRIKALERIR